jgi:predicted nucleic acid-binding Zn ribbon protein
MAKKLRRTPRGYDDVGPTSKELSKLLPEWLSNIHVRFQDRPDLVLLAWKEVIGEKLAPMTQAVSFIDGVLTVKVKNSSLYSLLVQHERRKLLEQLRGKVPSVDIRNITFRLG